MEFLSTIFTLAGIGAAAIGLTVVWMMNQEELDDFEGMDS